MLANQRSATTLLAIQGALLVVLLAYLLILRFTPDDARHLFWLSSICSLVLLLSFAILLNFRGNHHLSIWTPVASVIVPPWIPVLL